MEEDYCVSEPAISPDLRSPSPEILIPHLVQPLGESNVDQINGKLRLFRGGASNLRTFNNFLYYFFLALNQLQRSSGDYNYSWNSPTSNEREYPSFVLPVVDCGNGGFDSISKDYIYPEMPIPHIVQPLREENAEQIDGMALVNLKIMMVI